MPASVASAMPRSRLRMISPRQGSGLEARIKIVAQRVAEQIEGEHRKADGRAREQDHPRRLAIEVGRIPGQHQAPGGCRLGYTEAEEGEGCFEQDRLRD